jgi:hypothetical protein
LLSPCSDEVEAGTKWYDGAVGKSSLTASSSHGRIDDVWKTSKEHTCTRELMSVLVLILDFEKLANT